MSGGTYKRSEVRYLERRIISRDMGNFIVPTIDLGGSFAFLRKRCKAGMVGITKTYQCVRLNSRDLVACPGEFEVQRIK
jgi:hypothetical protein